MHTTLVRAHLLPIVLAAGFPSCGTPSGTGDDTGHSIVVTHPGTYDAAASPGDMLEIELDDDGYAIDVTAGNRLADLDGRTGTVTSAIDACTEDCNVLEMDQGGFIITSADSIALAFPDEDAFVGGVPQDCATRTAPGVYNVATLLTVNGTTDGASYGSLELEAGGDWAYYDADEPGGAATLEGTWSEGAGGIVNLAAFSINAGRAVFCNDTIYVDFDYDLFGAESLRGMLMGTRRRSVAPPGVDVSGTYDIIGGFEGLIEATITGTQITGGAALLDLSADLLPDTPWEGLFAHDRDRDGALDNDEAVLLISPSGVLLGGRSLVYMGAIRN